MTQPSTKPRRTAEPAPAPAPKRPPQDEAQRTDSKRSKKKYVQMGKDGEMEDPEDPERSSFQPPRLKVWHLLLLHGWGVAAVSGSALWLLALVLVAFCRRL